jgi:hypothetical protein
VDEAAGAAYDQVFVNVNDGFAQAQWIPFEPPTEKCNVYRGDSGTILTNITSPSSGATVDLEFDVSATAVGPHPITRVEFYLDNNYVGQTSISPYSYSFDLPSSTSNGNHTVSVKSYDSQGVTGFDEITVKVQKSGGGPIEDPLIEICFPNPRCKP